MKTIACYDLKRAPYRETWDLQTAIQQRLIQAKMRKNDTSQLPAPEDVFLFVEHPHVYTLGKSGDPTHLLRSDAELHDLDAEYVKIDRGGDITYHGPGQIVGYPILDLDRYFTDIHKYLRFLEETMIRVCADYSIKAGRIEKLTGVWVDDAKVAAFGIKCSRWVTTHGFALNVNTQLDYFGHIVPCGINDKKVCSLSSLIGRKIDEIEVKKRIIYHFETLFEATFVLREGTPPETALVPGWEKAYNALNTPSLF
jgi:lipoyl(octanoyl) transferase